MIGIIENPEFEGWRGSVANTICGEYKHGPSSTNILNFVTGGAISADYCTRWYDYTRRGTEEMFPPPLAWQALPVPPDTATVNLSNYWEQITGGTVNKANEEQKQFMSNVVDLNDEREISKKPLDYMQLLSYVAIVGLGLVIVKKI